MAILTPHGPRFGRSSRRTARPWLPTLSGRRKPTKSAVRRLLSEDFSPSPASGTCRCAYLRSGPALACISASITTATRPPTSRLAIPPPPCALPAGGKEPRHSTRPAPSPSGRRSEEHTSELQSQSNLVCRLLLEKKKKKYKTNYSTETKKTKQP